jgi:hypothetical protein
VRSSRPHGAADRAPPSTALCLPENIKFVDHLPADAND